MSKTKGNIINYIDILYMSAGSGASNLGYGNINPYNNSPYVNGTSTNYAGSFSSNEIPGLPGLAGAKSNIDAAAGIVPGICLFKGGAKKLKRKIKNITKQYKTMKGGSTKMKSLKNRLKTRMASRSMALAGGRRTRRRRRRRQRGGYSQYQNNQPFDYSYSVGGILNSSNSALANPAPIYKVSNNAIDNYNHYTNKGFPSKGH
jgi:hypothetical protein